MMKPALARLAVHGRRLFRRFRKDRRGNVMMILGFAMIPMTFGVGFGIDYTRAMRLNTKLSAAADAAALAAVNVKMMQQSDDTAKAAARAMFNAQVKDLQGLVYDATDANNPTITIVSTGGVNTGRTVTVAYSAKSANIFSGILGVQTLPVVGSSTSNATRAPHINFYLLMDTSPSMLLPSTSAGIDALITATKSKEMPDGCAFACHVQNPQNDKIFLRNKFYNSKTGNFTDPQSGADLNYNTYKGNYIWVDKSGAYCVYASEASGVVTCTNGTKYNKADGQYADTYWITRNYAAVYGVSANIPLRIDEEQLAAQNLIPFAITTATNNQVTYRLQLFTFDWTRDGGSHPVQTVTSTMDDVNNMASYTVPNFYNAQWNWYQNGWPTSSYNIDDKGSEVHNALVKMNAIMPTPGDGSTSANPQQVLFIITDGVADEQNGGSRWNREWNSQDLADCTTIKNRNIRIAILYTEYLSKALDSDSWSKTNVQPYLNKVEPALQSCASKRPDGTPLYYKVTTDESIPDALAALFSLTVQSAHLIL